VSEVFRALQNRLRDSTWTVVFKSLITVHLMIREGSPDVTLAYLARHRSMLAISSFSDGMYTQSWQEDALCNGLAMTGNFIETVLTEHGKSSNSGPEHSTLHELLE
jgi:hypothetical protein